jgi:TatD DNase family protein
MITKAGSIVHAEFLDELKSALENGAVFTDTHAHIHFPPLSDDTAGVMARAAENGVKRMVTVGIDLKDSLAAQKMSRMHDNVFFTAGVHPHDAAEFTSAQIADFEEILSDKKALAVGEIGLDYFRDHSPRDRQREVFLIFLDMAVSLGKPVVIHNRDASADCISVMDSVVKGREKNGIIHCYDGSRDMLKWALDNGFYISYAGPVTYAKAEELRDTVNYVPLDRLFIETDCPYLTPSPFRGKTNEPSLVVYTAHEICRLKNIGLAELASVLEQNFNTLFG